MAKRKKANGAHRRGAIGLYMSMLREGAENKAIAASQALTMPVMAVGAGGGEFTAATMSQVSADRVHTLRLSQGPGALRRA